MFIAVLFIIAKRQKQSKCALMDKWKNKMWYIHTIKYYSTIKWNKVLIHATIQVNLKNIMLCERSQSQKTTYCMFPYICNVQNKEIHRESKSIGGCQELGEEENWQWLLMGIGCLFRVMKIWNQTVVMIARTCEYTKKHGFAYVKRVKFIVSDLYFNNKKHLGTSLAVQWLRL